MDGALAPRGNHGNSNKIQQSEDYSLGVTQAVLRYGVSANRTEPQSLALIRRVLAFSQRLSPKGSEGFSFAGEPPGSATAQAGQTRLWFVGGGGRAAPRTAPLCRPGEEGGALAH